MMNSKNKMVIEDLETSQLPNNCMEVFKSHRLLTLNNINIIARSSDGYINLNQLCDAGNKRFRKWKEHKKSKAFLEVLSSSALISADELIKYNSGSNSERANWGHPQVAINVAQWVSPEFDVKVSKFVFELMLFGKVELGKEKTTKQLDNKLQEMLSVDITEYERDDVLYIATFTPTDEYIDDNEDKIFGKFGVSSGIELIIIFITNFL
jgi:hypothetical protein